MVSSLCSPSSPSALQLMTWASYSVLEFTDGPGNHTYTAFTDLTNLKSTLVDVTNIKHDMFCPGAISASAASVSGRL